MLKKIGYNIVDFLKSLVVFKKEISRKRFGIYFCILWGVLILTMLLLPTVSMICVLAGLGIFFSTSLICQRFYTIKLKWYNPLLLLGIDFLGFTISTIIVTSIIPNKLEYIWFLIQDVLMISENSWIYMGIALIIISFILFCIKAIILITISLQNNNKMSRCFQKLLLCVAALSAILLICGSTVVVINTDNTAHRVSYHLTDVNSCAQTEDGLRVQGIYTNIDGEELGDVDNYYRNNEDYYYNNYFNKSIRNMVALTDNIKLDGIFGQNVIKNNNKVALLELAVYKENISESKFIVKTVQVGETIQKVNMEHRANKEFEFIPIEAPVISDTDNTVKIDIEVDGHSYKIISTLERVAEN